MAGSHFTIASAAYVDPTHVDVTFVGVFPYVLTGFTSIGDETVWTLSPLTVVAVIVTADPHVVRLVVGSPPMSPGTSYVAAVASGAGNPTASGATMTPGTAGFTTPFPAFHATSAAFHDSTHVDVTFDEDLTSPGTPAAYAVHGPDGSTPVTVVAVTQPSTRVARLTVAPIVAGALYTVAVAASDGPTASGFAIAPVTLSFGMSFPPSLKIRYVFRDEFGGNHYDRNFRTTGEADAEMLRVRTYPDQRLERVYRLRRDITLTRDVSVDLWIRAGSTTA